MEAADALAEKAPSGERHDAVGERAEGDDGFGGVMGIGAEEQDGVCRESRPLSVGG